MSSRHRLYIGSAEPLGIKLVFRIGYARNAFEGYFPSLIEEQLKISLQSYILSLGGKKCALVASQRNLRA